MSGLLDTSLGYTAIDGLNLLVWRPVIHKYATLMEIDTHYTLKDLAILNDMIDAEIKATAENARKVNR